MWFGTQDGLNRYDGYKFTIFRHDPDNSNSLSNNDVTAIYEDSSGVLWIGTRGGLNKYDPETEKFFHWSFDPDSSSSLSHNHVTAILEDPSGMLWVATRNGLNRFDKHGHKFTRLQHDPYNPQSLSHDYVKSICLDKSGSLWVGTFGGGLDLYDKKSGGFLNWKNNPDEPSGLNHNQIRTLFEDRSGFLWIGTVNGLNRFDKKQGVFENWLGESDSSQNLSIDDIFCIEEDRFGKLWVGTWEGGLVQINRERNKVRRILPDRNDPVSLSSNSIFSLYEDRSGVLWVGTNGAGLCKIIQKQGKFLRWFSEPTTENGLTSNVVMSIFQDRAGDLWIGTVGGLNKYDRNKRKLEHWLNERDNPRSLSHNYVTSILEDRSGSLWIGTNGGGLNRFDQKEERFFHWRHEQGDPKTLIHDIIITMLEDHAGVLWIGTVGGLCTYDKEKGTFKSFINESGNPNSLSYNFIASLYEDRSNVLWVGTWGGGLDRYDRQNGTFANWVNEPRNSSSLSNDIVMSIHEDSAGFLWLGTKGGGLNKFDPQSGTFFHFKEKDGLPNDVIYGILEDNSGSLWLSTNKGLSKFNPVTEEFRNYDVFDGLQSNEFNQGAYFKTINDEMFFGGINGFNSFYPDSIRDNPYVPPIVITDFQIFNNSVDVSDRDSPLKKSISETEEIKLSYKENVFSFEFAALSYIDPWKNQYAYKMEGFDKDWTFAETRRYATYTNLNPGSYSFRVKGSNNDNVWNETGISIDIAITPPFWQIWWFKLLSGIILLALAFSGYMLRMRSVREQQKKLEIQVAEKTREIREAQARLVQSEKMAALGKLTAGIAHEMNSPLGVVKSNSDTLRRFVARIEKIIEICGKPAELKSTEFLKILDGLKETSDISQSASDRISKIVTSLKNFTRLDETEFKNADLHEGLESVLILLQHEKRDGIDIIKDFGDIPNIYCNPGELNQVFMTILRNAMQAIETRGSITIKTYLKESFVHVIIFDTGKGISPEKLKTLFDFSFTIKSSRVGVGMGLMSAITIVEKHGGEIVVSSQVGKGSEFDIKIPIRMI